MRPSNLVVPKHRGLSRARFAAEHLEPELPVVVEGVADDWPARHWTPQWLVERWGDHPVRAFYHDDALYTAWRRSRRNTTWGALVGAADPRLFASADFLPEVPYLIEDIGIPEMVDPAWVVDQASFWVQFDGHRTGLHWDTYSSLITVVYGRKRVHLLAPDQTERLYPCHVTGSRDFSMGSWSRLDVFAPDDTRFPAARDAERTIVEIEAGETLLIPRHWWHAVENLGHPTMAFSFFLAPQGRPEAVFFHDRRVIAGLSIKLGVLSGDGSRSH